MSGFRHEITGGGGNLVIPSVQSPNFVQGSAGWQIAKNGSAEFNDVTVRGMFSATDFQINSNGAFFYSGTPALGNLIASITPATGTDAHGNAYLAGNTGYFQKSLAWYAVQTGAILGIQLWQATAPGGPWNQTAGISADTSNLYMQANSRIVMLSDVVGNDNGGAATWHPLTFVNSWGNSGSGTSGQYRRLPTGAIEIIGDLSVPASPNTVIATLPSGYTIASLQQADVTVISSTGSASVLTPRVSASAGSTLTLTAQNIPTGTTRVFVHGVLPQDA